MSRPFKFAHGEAVRVGDNHDLAVVVTLISEPYENFYVVRRMWDSAQFKVSESKASRNSGPTSNVVAFPAREYAVQ